MQSELREPGVPVAEGVVPLSVPNISGNEWRYVKECLDSGWVSSAGDFVDRFERGFADAVGAPHAVAMASGTAALHVALLVAGVQPGDEVIVPSLTFIAPANAVRYIGAWPVFVDVDADYWQLDPTAVEAFLADRCQRVADELRNRRTGRRVKAILPVDLLGTPVDLERLTSIAAEYGLAMVEDATESLGSTRGPHRIGGRGAPSCFSFNGNKLLTTGGGGMVTTGEEALAKRVRYLATQAKVDPIEFVHGDVGFNYRLTNVQAAIGCAQLEQLDAFVAVKRRVAGRYAEALGSLPGVTLMRDPPWGRSVFWLYTVLFDASVFGRDSRALMRALEDSGVQTRPLWQPLHCSPAHEGSDAGPCPTAERLQRDALSLPCSTGITQPEQERVIEAILKAAP